MVTRNVVGWFEIPADDMDRAVKFYNQLFGWQIKNAPFGDGEFMAIFPADFTQDLPGAGGCLFKGKDTKPGDSGTIVYFSSPTGDCKNELVTAREMGAEILMDHFEIPEGHGFMFMIRDSEGNRIAVHSNK